MAGSERREAVWMPGRWERRLRVAALACSAAALVLLVAYWLSWRLMGPPASAVLPPAGEVLDGKAPFRFAYLADNRGNLDVLEAIFEQVKADNVGLILHGGDLVIEPATQDYEWLLHELDEAKLSVPFCPVAGNHDICVHEPDLAASYRLYSRSFGPRRYWFAYANTLFVVLDTAAETCREVDLRWLDRTLARHRSQYEACIVYTHCPPRDPRKAKAHCLQSGGDELECLLKVHRVTALFASHIHSCLEDRIEGVPVYISGGGGAEADEPLLPCHYLLCMLGAGRSAAGGEEGRRAGQFGGPLGAQAAGEVAAHGRAPRRARVRGRRVAPARRHPARLAPAAGRLAWLPHHGRR